MNPDARVGPGAVVASRPSRPNLLYVVHRVPYPPDKGDRIRAYHVLKALSERAAVHLACLADEPTGPSTLAALRRDCERVEVVPLDASARWFRALSSLARGRTATEGAFRSPGLERVLRRWAGQVRFHAALASASSMAPYLRMDALREIPCVVDLVDVDSQKWLDYAGGGLGPRAWLYRVEGRRLGRLERSLAGWARAITLVSPAEVEVYRRRGGAGAVHSVTNGVDLEAFRPSSGEGMPGCVFVGALDYRPNVEGACWFGREVWPEIRRLRPGATFRLVGRRPAPAVRRLAKLPGVELIGQVPDIRPFVAGTSVVVAPLRIARGVQNKVLEAMAMGKPVVATPQALEGLRAEPGVHALGATTPGQWVEAVVRLLDDPALRGSLGAAGRLYVEESHRWDRCLEPLADLLGLGGGPPDVGGPAMPPARDAVSGPVQ